MQHLLSTSLLMLAFSASSASAQQTLQQTIDSITAEPAVARDHWGISVRGLDGAPLATLNDAQLFHPESNAKLITTAAAMALLGPQRTFETRVIGRLDPASGLVDGPLTLIGGGDPAFNTQDVPYTRAKPNSTPPSGDLEAMADAIYAAGVRRVTGGIVGDDSYFPSEPYPASWAADDLVWGYGAPVSALTIQDNQLRLTIAPSHAGSPASVNLQQSYPYLTVMAEADTSTSNAHAGIDAQRSGQSLRVFGAIPAGASVDAEEIAIADPALYAAGSLKAMLEARGVTVEGSLSVKHSPVMTAVPFASAVSIADGRESVTVAGGEAAGSCIEPAPPAGTVLARHISHPMADDIVFTNKTSQNLHAELLLHHLGRRVTCARGTTVEGARLVRAFLVHAGIDPQDFFLFDGSGLSQHDLVTPRALTTLLTYAATQPWFAQWKASLPVGGVDGSLANRFMKPPLQGKVFAKTGSDSENRALSGYLQCASGKVVVFSILATDHLPSTSADREAMDRIVAAIFAAN